MKKILSLLAALVLAVAAFAQNQANGPVTKKVGGANANDINEDLNIGSGRTEQVKSGGTLNGAGTFDFSAGTLTLANNQVGWAKVNKSGSSLADLPTRLFSDLQSKPTSAAGYGITNGAAVDSWGAITRATGFDTFTATPSSLNLRGLITDETGTGLLYFQGGDIGTPSAGNGSNLTSLNANNLGSGTVPAARFPAFTGDITTSAGAVATTLATVNSNTGSWGSATQAPVITLDGKGRATAASNVTITPAWSSITSKPTAVDGSTTQTANTFYAGPSSGSAATPTFRALAQADVQAAAAPNRNALAPRGGVTFNGTTSSKVYAALTGQSLATDPFTRSTMFRVPTANGNAAYGVWFIGATSAGGGGVSEMSAYIDTGGTLNILLRSASTSNDWNRWQYSGFRSAFSGKIVLFTFVRNASGNPTFYVNAVDVTSTGSFTTAGTPPTWQGTVASSYMGIGLSISGEEFNGAIYCDTLYNCALTAADVQEIYELGGAVPPRFQLGSQPNAISSTTRNSDFSAGATDWNTGTANNATVTLNTGTSKLDVTFNTTGFVNYQGGLSPSFYGNWPKEFGRRMRMKYDITNFTGTGACELTSPAALVLSQQITANGSYNVEVQESLSGPGLVWVQRTATVACSFTIDNVVIQPLGAVVHLSLDDGIGFQLKDSSSNGLHALATTTGVSHLRSSTGLRGAIRATTSTNGNQQLAGGSLIPNSGKAVLRTWFITNVTGGACTVTLGKSSGDNRYVVSQALNSGAGSVTMITSFADPSTGGFTDLWCASNTTNVLRHSIQYETYDP